MLPFSRMLEYGNEIDTNLILDVDFSTADIGSTTMVDSRGTNFILRGTSVGKVVYSSEVDANVMDCSSSTGYFRTAGSVYGTVLDFTKYDAFQIKYKMKCSPVGIQTFYETGNYNSRRILGFVNSFNQYPNTYNQLFVDYGTNYARVLPTWVNPNAWDTITMQFRKDVSITVHSELYGDTQTFPWYPMSSSTSQYFSLFGSYVDGDNGSNPYQFKGQVQYVNIRKIV